MFDIIGIGIGPFNLSLASLLNHKDCHLKTVFFDKKEKFIWHQGMLMPDTTLQVPFLADLVTMVDPTNKYSFLNYLQEKQRLFQFYFKESFFLPRIEYNNYCQWVCSQLENLNFGCLVKQILPINKGFNVIVECDGKIKNYECKNLVIGIGTSPNIPDCTKNIVKNLENQCFHSSDFMKNFDELLKKKKSDIILVGSGQSAGEIFYKLIQNDFNNIHWVTDDEGFFPMEYTPLALEHFSPDYMDFFYILSEEARKNLLKKQDFLYKGINSNLLKNIYSMLYQKIILNNEKSIKLNSNLKLIQTCQNQGKICCDFVHNYTNTSSKISADYVILATGYQQASLDFMSELDPCIKKQPCGSYDIYRNYEVNYQHPNGMGRIFVQNMGLCTHGVGTPDLGLSAHRSATIINRILDKEFYKLSRNNILSNFS